MISDETLERAVASGVISAGQRDRLQMMQRGAMEQEAVERQATASEEAGDGE